MFDWAKGVRKSEAIIYKKKVNRLKKIVFYTTYCSLLVENVCRCKQRKNIAYTKSCYSSRVHIQGIDLGNLQAVIAVARNRGIDVICNEVSNRATPYVISAHCM